MRYFTLSICLIFSLYIQAQRPSKDVQLTGIVLEKEGGIPLEYATITLVNTKNTKEITGGITATDGSFAITVKTGVYDINVEYISFQTFSLKAQRITEDISLGTIQLEIDAATLEEVTVVAEKTTVEYRLDKQIYNVGKDLTVRGATVSDVLDNVPSVSVDVEGNVSLRGNDDVRILINGKPSGLIGLNGTDALRQLPAESIERVEVITSPSARYDAEGGGGILNIILRRSKLQGLNGAITANLGYPERYGLSGNVNYRTGDFNFFTTGSYDSRETPGNSFTSATFPSGNTLEETRDFERQRNGFTSNFGVEYYLDDNTSITGSVVLRDSDNENDTENNIINLDPNDAIISRTDRFTPQDETDQTVQYSLNFDKRWENEGNLSIELQYEDSDEDEFALISNVLVAPVGPTERETNETLETQRRFLAQADFVLPIGDVHRFEAGYRGNFNELDTDFAVSFEEDGVFELDTDLTNNLVYRENINAVYTQWGSKIKKFNYLLGLRLEHTDITVDQRTSNDFSDRNFTNLFPTVNLNYEIDDKQTVSLGYNRRIRRARNRFINPFPSRTSATSLFQGNPDINPSLSNGVDLGYLNRLGKVTISGSVFFRRSSDIFTFITEETGDTALINGEDVPVVRRIPVNLSRNDRIGGELTLTYSPSRKWRLNLNGNVFNSETVGVFEDTDFGAEILSWFVRLNNRYTLPGGVDWQTRIFYRGPNENAQSRTQGLFSMDFAFSKDLFKEKASIAFNVSDIFNSRIRRSDINFPFPGESEFQFRERTFNLSFTYRFNQKKRQERDGNRGGQDGGGEEFEGQP